MKHVQIQNADMAWHVAANVQFPPTFDESKQYPTIISVHPFGSCKEQTSGNVYGKALAEAGYVVIAYDASFQGSPAALHAGWRIRPSAWKISVGLLITP